MTEPARIILLPLLLLAGVAAAAPTPKLPKDAPYCARPGSRQLFVSPMGAPFRAASGEPYPSGAWIAAADSDRDGAVDHAEMAADARRFFTQLDIDHDGRLTPEEVAAYERDVAPEISLFAGAREPERRGSQGGGSIGALISGDRPSNYGGPMGAGRYAWLNIPEPVVAADADINRIVTADEFTAAAGKRFDQLDTQRTGRLTLAGLGRTPQQVAIEGPCRPAPKPRRGAPRGPFDDAPPGGGDEPK